MRVLHIVQRLRGGGAEALVRELVPRLRARQVDARVLCGFEADLTTNERAMFEDGITEAHKRGRYDLTFGARLVSAIRKSSPNIVHTHGHLGKYWGRACAVAAGVGVIVHTEHDPAPTLKRWEVPLTRALVGRTKTFITFSERNAEFLRRREPVPKHLAIIPNGIKLLPVPSDADRARARATLDASEDVTVFAIVANLRAKKNQRLAIEALASVPNDERVHMRIDLFGAGEDEEALRALARERDVESLVRFWGFRNDVRSLLGGCDALLTVATIEAAPISLLEAMSVSRPIIGTPHLGTLDMVRDRETGIVLRGWSSDEVASALRFAASERQWRSKAGAAGRLLLQRTYDIEIVASEHVALYKSIV